MRSEGCVRVWRQCANCAANWSSWWSPCNGVVIVMLASQSSGSCHTDDCRPAKIKFHARWSEADGFHDTFHIRIFPFGRLGNSNAILPMTSVASAGAYLLSAPVELEPNARCQLLPKAGATQER